MHLISLAAPFSKISVVSRGHAEVTWLFCLFISQTEINRPFDASPVNLVSTKVCHPLINTVTDFSIGSKNNSPRHAQWVGRSNLKESMQ